MALPPPNLEDLKKYAGGSRAFSTESLGKQISLDEEQDFPLKLTSSSNEYQFDRRTPVKPLKKLDAVAFSYVLHNVVDHLRILGCMGNLPQATCDLERKTLEEQYGDDCQQTYLFEAETLEANEAGVKTQAFLKIQRDRAFLEQLLGEAEDEVSSRLTVSKFLRRLEDHREAEEERNLLLTDTAASFETIKFLSGMLQHEKRRLTEELHEKSEELGVIKDQYEDLTYENEIKSKYVDHWEYARGYQSGKTLQEKEEYWSNAIRTHNSNYQKEIRINIEIDAFENYLQTTYAEETEDWMKRYSKDLDQKEMEKQVLKEKREEQMKALQNLTELYELHKREMEEYLVLREQRRAEAAELERLNRAATKIQAWWRGVMYRRGLGPYKKKGKKKNGAKGKKGDAKGNNK